MTEFTHLEPEVHCVLQWPKDERIEYAKRERWISYPQAVRALSACTDVLQHPKTLRMPNLLLVGESGNGKSTIVGRFTEQNAITFSPNGDPIAPVFTMEMPSKPDEARFWSALLTGMRIAHRPTANVKDLESQAKSVLLYAQTRLIFIDEIHNLLHGSALQQRHFLVVLKNLSNTLKISLACVGTREAIRALNTDPQMVSRFEPFGLPRWSMDAEFRNLLASFERLLPLAEPSQLDSRELAPIIHHLSGGTIGRVAHILKKATVEAILRNRERIDVALIKSLDLSAPEDFAKLAERL